MFGILFQMLFQMVIRSKVMLTAISISLILSGLGLYTIVHFISKFW
jgi:hypothetical protein